MGEVRLQLGFNTCSIPQPHRMHAEYANSSITSDLLVKNGLVANEYTVLPLDVAVQGEKVVALASHGALDAIGAQHVIDAQGKYVLPGGIDPHVHYDLSISAAMTAQSPVAGSRAGLYGGTTTYIDFSMQAGEESLVESIQSKMAHTAAQKPHADYALHAIMSGDWPLKNAAMMAEAISGGVVSFKFFTTFKGSPSIGGLMSDDGRIYSAMRETAKHGGITMVHCEDECIIDYHTRQLYAEGREQFWHIGEARPPLPKKPLYAGCSCSPSARARRSTLCTSLVRTRSTPLRTPAPMASRSSPKCCTPTWSLTPRSTRGRRGSGTSTTPPMSPRNNRRYCGRRVRIGVSIRWRA